MNKENDFQKLLADPFEESDVHWRVRQSGMTSGGKAWARIVPYISSRAVQQRLDDVFGLHGWENAFKETADGKGYLCGISFWSETRNQWITKWDGAEYTGIEALKGALSGATKRSAVQIGVGRYLYNLDECFAICIGVDNRYDVEEGAHYIAIPLDKNDKKAFKAPHQWTPPPLPAWALPNVQATSLIKDIKEATNVIALRSAYSKAYKYASSFNRGDLVTQIVETKDLRKGQLELESSEEDELELAEITNWLNNAIESEISLACNESVLKLAKGRMLNKLQSKALETGVELFGLLEILEDAYIKKLSSFRR